MRISDWSSDVCSSDLTGLIEGTVFGAVLQGGGSIDNEGAIRSTGTPNPTTGVTPFGIIMGATPDQTGRSATLNNQGSVSGSLGVLAGGALETATINNSGTITGQATENRSEEHTSELQSLLRISYAVFCLKNKR